MFSGTKGYRTKPPVGVRLNPLHPLSQGLVGYWLFNEGAGSVAHDISGHGNHGTLKNMSTNAQGSGWCGSKFGGGLNFDGTNNYVHGGDQAGTCISDPSISGALSVSLWAYIKGGYYILSTGAQTTSRGFMISYATGTKYVWLQDGTNKWALSGVSMPLNAWHHYVLAWDGSVLTWYVDGVVDATDETSDSYIKTDNKTILAFGCANSSLGSYTLNGSIDYVQIYNRTLSAVEIKQLYEDPFCNLLRVPVRYVAAAPGGLPIPVAMNYYRRRRVA